MNRLFKLLKRRKVLGERFTSDYTTRRFRSELIKKLDSDINFENLEYIYQIGNCKYDSKYHLKIKNLIKKKRIRQIQFLRGIEYGIDTLGLTPIGDYIDRGPSSAQVIDIILNLQNKGFQVFCIKGNHEDDFLEHFEYEIKNKNFRTKSKIQAFDLIENDEIIGRYEKFLNSLDNILKLTP